MTKIRTAKEVLKDIDPSLQYLNDVITVSRAVKAMQEYAKQFIDLAAEEAKVKYVYLPRDDERQAIVDTESILKLKERVV